MSLSEQRPLPPTCSFRLLAWSQPVDEPRQNVTPHLFVVRGNDSDRRRHLAIELTYISAGRGTRLVGDRHACFSAGDMVLLGTHLPHCWQTSERSTGISAHWSFPSTHPFWAFPETEPLGQLFRIADRGIHFRGKTRDRMADLLECMTLTNDLERLGLFITLLAAAAAAPEHERELLASASFTVPRDPSYQERMQTAIRYLLTHFHEDIALGRMLALTHTSKPTFCRQFKQHTGKSLRCFLQQIRIDDACRRLVETDAPVIEIALSSGFSHVSFFNRIFRRHLRCTPSEFRKRSRTDQRPPMKRARCPSIIT